MKDGPQAARRPPMPADDAAYVFLRHDQLNHRLAVFFEGLDADLIRHLYDCFGEVFHQRNHVRLAIWHREFPRQNRLHHGSTEFTDVSIWIFPCIRVSVMNSYAALGDSPEASGVPAGGCGTGAGVAAGVFSTSFFTRSDSCAPFDVQ